MSMDLEIWIDLPELLTAIVRLTDSDLLLFHFPWSCQACE